MISNVIRFDVRLSDTHGHQALLDTMQAVNLFVYQKSPNILIETIILDPPQLVRAHVVPSHFDRFAETRVLHGYQINE